MVAKTIISCAITGSVHVPSQTPHLPITPTQIAASAVGAANAGAAVVHLHARDPKTGQPSHDPEIFRKFLPEIKRSTNVVINITTGGGAGMRLEERLASAREFKPELCSLNMGTMNFGMYPILDTIDSFQHDWEKPYLEATKSWIFRNTFEDIEQIVSELSKNTTRFEFECYDVGHLYTLAHFLDKNVVKPPLFVQTIFGVHGGIGPDPDNLLFMRRTADRLFGDSYIWSVLAVGRHQQRLVTMAAIMGGSVRVGLEDSIYLGRGQLAESNAAQVEKIARILTELSIEIATPDDARQLLDLKGPELTAIP